MHCRRTLSGGSLRTSRRARQYPFLRWGMDTISEYQAGSAPRDIATPSYRRMTLSDGTVLDKCVNVSDNSEDVLFALRVHRAEIQGLTIARGVSQETMRALLSSSWPELRFLKVSVCLCVAPVARKLDTLMIEVLPPRPDPDAELDVAAVTRFIDRLRHLQIQSHQRLTVRDVDALPASLEYLTMSDVDVRRMNVSACVHLQRLKLDNCHQLESLRGLDRLHELTHLSLHGCPLTLSVDDLRDKDRLETINLTQIAFMSAAALREVSVRALKSAYLPFASDSEEARAFIARAPDVDCLFAAPRSRVSRRGVHYITRSPHVPGSSEDQAFIQQERPIGFN